MLGSYTRVFTVSGMSKQVLMDQTLRNMRILIILVSLTKSYKGSVRIRKAWHTSATKHADNNSSNQYSILFKQQSPNLHCILCFCSSYVFISPFLAYILSFRIPFLSVEGSSLASERFYLLNTSRPAKLQFLKVFSPHFNAKPAFRFLLLIFQGSYPFSETNFQDFSSTQIDFSRALKFTLTPTLPRSHSKLIFLHFIFLVEFNRFPEFSGTSPLFPGLSRPGKRQNKIPGLSRFSRTRTNPVFPVWRAFSEGRRGALTVRTKLRF